MSKINYQALREAAEKATKGSYIVGHTSVNQHGNITGVFVCQKWKGEPGGVIAECHVNCLVETDAQAYANAEFIAAFNPKVALALLDEINALEETRINDVCRIAELTKQLELAKSKLNEQREYYEGVISDGSKRIAELRDWNAGLAQESLTYQQRVAELEVIKSAAEKLVRCKGRYHSEQNYRALAALFGVTVPDLPPLEAESVSQTYKLNELSGNSPVTPDSWISCSERMPAQDDWILIYSKHGEYMAGQVQGEYVELSDGTLSWLGNVLFWMPLPEPPQEVNRG